MIKKKMAQVAEADAESHSPLYGDVLDLIMSRARTVDLLEARHVSHTWRSAVLSSLRRYPRLKPWLLLHLPRASVAYDPHSRSWVPLPRPKQHAPIRSSNPRLHFLLSPSNLSILQPPSATWTSLPSPRACRADPAVALVGSRTVVVAGGTCDFEDAACGAVESLDLLGNPHHWVPHDPIPSDLDGSATWLSVAASDDAMHVLAKNSGLFSSFRPETGKWSTTCDLRPDTDIHLSAIGFSGTRLVFVGLRGLSLKLWEVNTKNIPMRCSEEIGEMPEEMVERLVGEELSRMTTIGFSTIGDVGYFYNPDNFSEGFIYEFTEKRWESIGRPREVDDNPVARIVFRCSTVTLDHLDEVLRRSQ